MDHFFCAMALPMWTMWSPASVQNNHTDAPVSGTFQTLPAEPTPARAGTLLNLPPEPTPACAGICRNLPEPASGTYTSMRRNLPDSSGICLWNLHQHQNSLELSTEPASGTYTSTHRNPPELPEPLSGTFSCNPHRHTPELIWAEDPISLYCWGKNQKLHQKKYQKIYQKICQKECQKII